MGLGVSGRYAGAARWTVLGVGGYPWAGVLLGTAAGVASNPYQAGPGGVMDADNPEDEDEDEEEEVLAGEPLSRI